MPMTMKFGGSARNATLIEEATGTTTALPHITRFTRTTNQKRLTMVTKLIGEKVKKASDDAKVNLMEKANTKERNPAATSTKANNMERKALARPSTTTRDRTPNIGTIKEDHNGLQRNRHRRHQQAVLDHQ